MSSDVKQLPDGLVEKPQAYIDASAAVIVHI